jgi:hypothetical protein
MSQNFQASGLLEACSAYSANPKASIFRASGSFMLLVRWLVQPWGCHAWLDEAQESTGPSSSTSSPDSPPLIARFSRAVMESSAVNFFIRRFGQYLWPASSVEKGLEVHSGASLWWAQRQLIYMTGTMPNIVGITMPFPSQGECLMPYCGLMPYAMQFPASQLGSRMEVCVMRGCALIEVCLMRGSTVVKTRVTSSCYCRRLSHITSLTPERERKVSTKWETVGLFQRRKSTRPSILRT